MKCRYDNIIAIDPDKDKSGVAFLKPTTRQLEVSNLTFPCLMDYLQFCKRQVLKSKKRSLSLLKPGGWSRKAISMKRKDTGRKKSQRMSARTMKRGAR